MNAYTLELTFNDSTVQTIDFATFLEKQQNPSLLKYKNVDNFKSYTLKHGDLVWGDYEMCFPIWDLYEGKI
jgi:hypothetical protein